MVRRDEDGHLTLEYLNHLLTKGTLGEMDEQAAFERTEFVQYFRPHHLSNSVPENFEAIDDDN